MVALLFMQTQRLRVNVFKLQYLRKDSTRLAAILLLVRNPDKLSAYC